MAPPGPEGRDSTWTWEPSCPRRDEPCWRGLLSSTQNGVVLCHTDLPERVLQRPSLNSFVPFCKTALRCSSRSMQFSHFKHAQITFLSRPEGTPYLPGSRQPHASCFSRSRYLDEWSHRVRRLWRLASITAGVCKVWPCCVPHGGGPVPLSPRGVLFGLRGQHVPPAQGETRIPRCSMTQRHKEVKTPHGQDPRALLLGVRVNWVLWGCERKRGILTRSFCTEHSGPRLLLDHTVTLLASREGTSFTGEFYFLLLRKRKVRVLSLHLPLSEPVAAVVFWSGVLCRLSLGAEFLQGFCFLHILPNSCCSHLGAAE